MEEKIKVLVVDDASVMRRAVVDTLRTDPMIEVIDTAENGLIGLEKALRLRPDVITLDMDMPVMNGISAIRHIMIKCQIPIVVLSSLFTDGAITFEALRLGVVDFVPKPSGAVSRDLTKGKEMIIDRVKLAAAVKVGNIHRAKLPALPESARHDVPGDALPPEALVIIGTNLCGPNTVIRMIANLPPILRAGIVVIQDISLKILTSFAEQFNRSVAWTIKPLQEDTLIEPGCCYIGSTETSLSFTTTTEGRPEVLVGGPVDRPIDLLYSSAAATFQGPVVGVLLGGIGDDGAEGLAMIQRHQGTTLVQDTHYCVFPNLTENAIRCGVADKIVKDRDLAEAVQLTLEL